MPGSMTCSAAMNGAFLTPAETARRLGVSAKALRLYEQHGIVAPVRGRNGWRAYGPAQLARLHQAQALKRLGLTLARIGEVLRGGASLDGVLALQERMLARDSTRLERALALVRAARAKIASGEALSVDDLATLCTETTMTAKATSEQLKTIMQPFVDRHFTPEDRAELAKVKHDQDATAKAWDGLLAEAKALAAKGDPASPEALDLARRWQALVDAFTQRNPAIEAKMQAVWRDAAADPSVAPSLPLTPEIRAFVGRAMAALKAAGGE